MASDLSALHRIDDMYSMGSRRWAQLVPRLASYQGAVRTAGLVERSSAPAPSEQPEGGGVTAPQAPAGPWKPDTVVEASPAALQFSDIGDMFSFSTV